jgi:hypothetical protein
MDIYEHVPHPRTKAILTGKAEPPPKVDDGVLGSTAA